MAKVKVRVLNAVVDEKIKGSIIEIDEKSAKYLESIRYVERVPKNTKLLDASEPVEEEEEAENDVTVESTGGVGTEATK